MSINFTNRTKLLYHIFFSDYGNNIIVIRTLMRQYYTYYLKHVIIIILGRQ